MNPRNRSHALAVSGLALLLSMPAAAAASQDARHDAVERLGALNGIALHCGYMDRTRRIKEAVVAHATKERALGIAFDEATNESFLAVSAEARPCPGMATLDQRIERAVETLGEAFARP